MKRMTALVWGWLALALAARAATYVVDNRHSAAADTNPGTREAPFKTVSAAAAKVQPGDEVLVRPGLYREAVTLKVSGREDAPIVFRSEEPRAAIISGSDTVTNWQSEAPGVWSFADPSVRSNVYGNGEWVYVNDLPQNRVATRDRLLPGSFWQDFDAKRVWLSPEEGVRLEEATVEYARREGLFWPLQPLDDIRIIGFTLVHNADWFRGKPALLVSGQRWLVEGNHVLWGSYFGLTTKESNRAVLRGNLVEWCGDQGVGGGRTVGMLFESNVVRYCNWRRIDPGFEGGGSKWGSSMDCVVRGNEWYGNHGSGLWFDGANANCIFEQNVSHDNTIWGLFSEINWDMIIRDNVSYNNANGIMVAETPGAVVRRNICFNNEVGLAIRGDGRRPGAGAGAAKWFPDELRRMQAVPGIAPLALDRWATGFFKYWIASQRFMSNNSVIWENLVFDSQLANYREHRNYAQPSAMDPVINNFSDFNLWYAREPTAAFHSHAGAYEGGLAGWQKASGRDLHSLDMDPRAAGTNLPAWAEAKRALWDIRLRPMGEVRSLQLGLVPSPMSCVAQARISRSATVTNLVFKDTAIRGFMFEVDGQRTLGLWTTHPMERRYLRLNLGQDQVTVENGFLGQAGRPLTKGALDLVVTYVPTYLRGVGATITEAPASGLTAPMFNQPGAAVPVTVLLVNDGATKAKVTADLTVSPGFRVEPATVSRTLASGASHTATVTLTPQGPPRKGVGQVRMEVAMGQNRLVRLVPFGVGESAGVVPAMPGAVTIDGTLNDWGNLVKTGVPVGMVVDATQFANGNSNAWQGASDLSAKIYAAWTPQALYVAVDVTDDQVVTARPGASPWGSDAIELFVDGRSFDMQWQSDPTEGSYQIGVSPAKGAVPSNTQIFQKSMPDIETATALTDKGYVVEFRIPLTARNFPAGGWTAGRPLKMSVLLNDKDDPEAEGRKQCFGWAFSKEGANYRDTSGWQTLTLSK
jgi:hypothetical protein